MILVIFVILDTCKEYYIYTRREILLILDTGIEYDIFSYIYQKEKYALDNYVFVFRLWFNFTVSNTVKNQRIIFNLVNFR